MISRRSFGKIFVYAAAFLGFGKAAIAEATTYKPATQYKVHPHPFADYQKFLDTPYLQRMDLKSLYACYDDTPWGPDNLDYVSIYRKGGLERKFNYINRQVHEFREQESIQITGKPLKPMRECWREAVAEVNAKYYGVKE